MPRHFFFWGKRRNNMRARKNKENNMGIEQIHENIYQHLMSIRQEDPKFYFMPRRRKDARLKKGYWFLGNEDYLAVSFWSGSDPVNKTANISFFVVPPRRKSLSPTGCRSYVKLTARGMDRVSEKKRRFLGNMAKEISGFEICCKGEWDKGYSSIDYMKNLEEFLVNDKPKIDAFIGEGNIDELSLLNADSLKYLKAIEDIKNSKIVVP